MILQSFLLFGGLRPLRDVFWSFLEDLLSFGETRVGKHVFSMRFRRFQCFWSFQTALSNHGDQHHVLVMLCFGSQEKSNCQKKNIANMTFRSLWSCRGKKGLSEIVDVLFFFVVLGIRCRCLSF